MKTVLLALVVLLAAAGASAQTIYKTVSLDGRMTFSDRADVTPDPDAEPAAVPEERRTPAGTMARGSRGAVLVNTNEAQRRLAQAQRMREQGIAPLPGEHAVSNGARAVNFRYWKRQEKLRLLVEQAQQRLNATRQPQLARR